MDRKGDFSGAIEYRFRHLVGKAIEFGEFGNTGGIAVTGY